MNRASDWNQRKREIGMAFRRQPFLPHETDAEAYERVLVNVGVASNRDLSILFAIVQDAIMMARRDERPSIPLDNFRDWLMLKLIE